jgi:hypothetical protein
MHGAQVVALLTRAIEERSAVRAALLWTTEVNSAGGCWTKAGGAGGPGLSRKLAKSPYF